MNPVSASVIAAVLVLAFAGMLASWRRRGAAQRGLRLPAGGAAGRELAAASGTYLATTFAGRPLERVVAGGLGFRAAARLVATDTGLLVERAGSQPVVVPADRLTGAGSGTWALDRSVERGGLLLVGWSLEAADGAPVPVESAFRLDPAGQAAITDALAGLIPGSASPNPGGAP